MAANNPEFVFPLINNNDFNMQMKDAGHPLLDYKTRVCNNFVIPEQKYAVIVTGANMAGKSTFLRTVGVNMVFAMMGSVVCASEFKMSPIGIFTSVRTNDSLQKSESYFYAELKRLKAIIDDLNADNKMFVIIDEMLRGTNSKDKHHGSVALTEQLLRLNAASIVATHDIMLGNLQNKYPNNVINKRFEVQIKDNKLDFDYKLQDGVSQSLNATFLMKKMGITV
jgi:DNA mismatch repair ATPase MutS